MSLIYVSSAAPVSAPYRRYVLDTGLTLVMLDAACLLASHLIGTFEAHQFATAELVQNIYIISMVQSVLQLLFLYAFGSYRREVVVNTPLSITRLPVIAAFTGLATFVLLQPFTRVGATTTDLFVSGVLVLLTSAVSLLALILSRGVFRLLMSKDLFRRRIVVVGSGRKATYLHELMSGTTYRPTVTLVPVPEYELGLAQARSGQADSLPRDRESLTAIARSREAAEIVVALDDLEDWPVDELLASKLGGIRVTDYSTFIERETGRVDLEWLDIHALLYSRGVETFIVTDLLKRIVDVSLCLFCGFLVLPVMLTAVLCIYCETGAPIFYGQERVTLHGRRFKLFKLRTMRQDAEKNGPQWADQRDRRITRVGSFLRRTRIDEIPQLLNVIRGEMSLVGPRPERPVFTEGFSKTIPFYDMRHSVRAGLTGWAQINFPYGASAEDAKRKLEYDLFYIKNYSLWRDLVIMLQTVRILVWQEGVR